MITFLFIALAAFCKAISDTIRVYEVFTNSKLKKFVGNRYIDPDYSWKNKYKVGFKVKETSNLKQLVFFINWILSVIVAPLSDLWHLCQTLMIISFLLIPTTILYFNLNYFL